MPPSHPARKVDSRGVDSQDGSPPVFTLYVEGPRDRSILRAWAYRLMPAGARVLFEDSVILGGRQPERALDHFRQHWADAPGARGLCVLDRDGGDDAPPDTNGYALDFFTWGRRHIESYLLVPAAIRRALALSDGDHRVDRALDAHLPESNTSAWERLDAKKLLGTKGPLSRAFGSPLPLTKIARATRESELDADVHDLFALLRERFDSPSR